MIVKLQGKLSEPIYFRIFGWKHA